MEKIEKHENMKHEVEMRIAEYCRHFSEGEELFQLLTGVVADREILSRIDYALRTDTPIQLDDPILTTAFYSDYIH